MNPEDIVVNFIELGSRLESEFVLMRDVKLRIKYPRLRDVACMVYSAIEVGKTEGLNSIGVENLGDYLILLRKEDSSAERAYYGCVEFLNSKRGV